MEPSDFERRLAEYIAHYRIPAEQLIFSQSCHSVAEAAAAAGVTRQDFVKSICFIAQGELVVAVVKGEDRASAGRVSRLLGCERPRPATGEEMLERTGYPCGGTPPFGFPARYLVDDRVLQTPMVYAGGGSPRALIRIPSHELVSATGATVARVRS